MATAELAVKKEIVLSSATVEPVGHRRHITLLPQLARIYYETWEAEGLCSSLREATEKMSDFNPEDCYVVIDSENQIYALVQTLPLSFPNIDYLPHVYSTYAEIERVARLRQKSLNPNMIVCFSINALPGYRVQTPEGNQSLPRYLLTNIPTPPGVRKIAYSRFSAVPEGTTLFAHYVKNLLHPKNLGPVGMHEYFGAITYAAIEDSRPEDIKGGGGNALVSYPLDEEEATAFMKVRANRLLHPPPTRTEGPITIFVDIPLKISPSKL